MLKRAGIIWMVCCLVAAVYAEEGMPFLIVPIIGAMFADLINTAIITLFLNLM